SRFYETHLRINLDQLRTRNRESILLNACIQSKTRFVWDNTNVARADRQPMINTLLQAHYEVIAFYFERDFEASMRRNALRTGRARVHEVGIKTMSARLEKPVWDEGYTAIFTVKTGEKGQFHVQEWEKGINQ
ncbi:ATP-binding protein, partial [bacterium]